MIQWAAVLLASQLLAAEPEPVTVTLDAERIIHDGQRKLTNAEGNAELRATNAAMSADRIVWDENAQGATATGHVTVRLTKGSLLGIVADVVSVRVEGDEVHEIFIYEGLVLRKKGVTPEQLLAAKTQDEVRQVGGTSMTMSSSHLQKEDDGTWRIDELTFTPCDCDLERPVWGITASKTTVDLERERVSLFSPVVRVKGVPVLWFPWLSLPLSNRQTGLLVPKPAFTALNGFGIEQPVFITFGESADLTVTPGYFFGAPHVTNPFTNQSGPNAFGIRGPRLALEFRHTPQVDNSGRVTFGTLYDLQPLRNPVNPWLVSESGVMRGPRFDATWQHAQTIGKGWGNRADMQFLSDGYLQRDLVTDVLARENGYTRSTLSVFHRGDDHYFGLDVAFRQDVTYGYPVLFGPSTADVPGMMGLPANGPNPLQRLPGITFAVPEKKLVGPLSWSFRAEYARIAPTFSATGDEGTAANGGFATINGTPVTLECQQQLLFNATPNPAVCPAGIDFSTKAATQGDRIYQPGERQGRDRLDVMPSLTASGTLGDVLSASAFASWRQTAWVGEITGDPGTRGYGLVGGRVDSELGRTFASGTWRHTIAPSVELRGVPFAFGAQPAPYDAIDAAIPSLGPQLQGRANVKQRILYKDEVGMPRELLSLDLGQAYDLLGTRPSESYARLGLSYWLARVSVTARVDPYAKQQDAGGSTFFAPRLNRLSASASVDNGRGRGVFVSYERLIDEATDRARAPYDLFFGGAPLMLTQGTPEILTGGARWRIGGFGARYDIMLMQRLFSGAVAPVLTLTQHTVGLSYGPACECWRVELFATQRVNETLTPPAFPTYRFPDIGATVTISGFGNIGSGQ